MARTKVTDDEISLNKYVDANGYTVIDYGDFKEYYKKFSGIASSVLGHNFTLVVSDEVLPVGIADVRDVFILVSDRVSNVGVRASLYDIVGNLPTSSLLKLYLFNGDTTDMADLGWEITVKMIDV